MNFSFAFQSSIAMKTDKNVFIELLAKSETQTVPANASLYSQHHLLTTAEESSLSTQCQSPEINKQ